MASPLKALQRQPLHVSTRFAATYRTTADFFATRDTALKKYSPKPFKHWQRSETHFNLISAESRKVIRFEANRFVLRAEGHPTVDSFLELIPIAKDLLETFGVTDLFGALFVSVRSRPMKALEQAREEFARQFLTSKALKVAPVDGLTDFGVIYERRWASNLEFKPVKPSLAVSQVTQQISIGPVSYKEVGEKWVEFKKDTDNTLYQTELVAHKFGILADMRFHLNRRKGVEQFKMDVLWKFLEWARESSDEIWNTVEG